MDVVTRLRAAETTDPFSGEQVRGDWENPDRKSIKIFAFEPGSSTERDSITEQSVSVVATIYADYDADVTANDRIDIDGMVFAVVGEPGRWRSPFSSWAPGCVISLGRLPNGS